MTEEKKWKQGKSRKVSENNFYAVNEYLFKRIDDSDGEYFNIAFDAEHSIRTEFIEFFHDSPGLNSSKSHINKKIEFLIKRRTLLKNRIETDHYPFPILCTKEGDKKEIEAFEQSITKVKCNYIQLTDEKMCKLHMYLTMMHDNRYKALVNWVKQKRFRDKQETHQVTLSSKGKNALDDLKNKLGAADFNETLHKLNCLHQ
jgi:hypothetical protein